MRALAGQGEGVSIRADPRRSRKYRLAAQGEDQDE